MTAPIGSGRSSPQPFLQDEGTELLPISPADPAAAHDTPPAPSLRGRVNPIPPAAQAAQAAAPAAAPADLPLDPKWDGKITVERLEDIGNGVVTGFRFNVTIGETRCLIPVYPKFATIENATLILNKLIAACCGNSDEKLSAVEGRFKKIKESIESGGILAVKKEEQEDPSIFKKKQKKDPLYGVYRLGQEGVLLTASTDIVGMIAVTDDAIKKIAALLASMRGASPPQNEAAIRLTRLSNSGNTS